MRQPTSHLRRGAPNLLLAFAFAVLGVTFINSSVGVAGATSYHDEYGTSYNGYKVFLSPAYHTATPGARGECQNKVERYMAQNNATEAGFEHWSGFSITERGFKVAIGFGSPTANKNDSNSWGADIHVLMHSNSSPGGCGAISTGSAGTHVIYKSTSGSTLAGHMRDKVGTATGSYGSPSPGTNDLKCHVSSNCTIPDCLIELCSTTAVAAYLEQEFHNWDSGINWLVATNWQERIGWAIDVHLGYP